MIFFRLWTGFERLMCFLQDPFKSRSNDNRNWKKRVWKKVEKMQILMVNKNLINSNKSLKLWIVQNRNISRISFFNGSFEYSVKVNLQFRIAFLSIEWSKTIIKELT